MYNILVWWPFPFQTTHSLRACINGDNLDAGNSSDGHWPKNYRLVLSFLHALSSVREAREHGNLRESDHPSDQNKGSLDRMMSPSSWGGFRFILELLFRFFSHTHTSEMPLSNLSWFQLISQFPASLSLLKSPNASSRSWIVVHYLAVFSRPQPTAHIFVVYVSTMFELARNYQWPSSALPQDASTLKNITFVCRG